jgi:hypothetical protein
MAINASLTASIPTRIWLVRERRVILDSDLARVYGVSTKRLNEQVRRNRDRFPEDFAFQLTPEEFGQVRAGLSPTATQDPDQQEVYPNWSQFATSSARHRGAVYRPWAFTEHGALMAANVLNSPRAVRMSVEVVRAFVRIREMVNSHKELSRRLDELEMKYDRQFKVVFDAIRGLMIPPEPKTKRRIGFVSDG